MDIKIEFQPRSVQELAVIVKEPPQNFFFKGGDGGALDSAVPLVDVPVVDIGLLTSPSPSSLQELEKLRSALSTWGCFQIVNHGMTIGFLDKAREVAEQFFALPMAEKQKYSKQQDSFEGYGNDVVLSDQQTVDWTDRLYLTLSPEDQRQYKFWPQNPEAFREVLHEYTINLKQVNEILLKAMAKSLSLQDDSFLNQYGEGEQALMSARYNFYPPCPRPDLILGVKPHADGSVLTFLLQDEVEGLQFLKDKEWFRVPIIPHALLINVGDQIEIMSNGIFKSPVHRVVTNSERHRISLAVFSIPHSDKEIQPLDELVTEAKPRLYRKVKDYVSLYFQYYQQGRRPIEAAQI